MTEGDRDKVSGWTNERNGLKDGKRRTTTRRQEDINGYVNRGSSKVGKKRCTSNEETIERNGVSSRKLMSARTTYV